MSVHVDLDAEAAVLGSVLLGGENVLLSVRAAGLRSEHFYRESYGDIYAAMTRLHAESRPIDALTVHAMLRGHSEVTKGDVEALTVAAPVMGNAGEYARVVVSEARWRWRERNVMEMQEAIQRRDRVEYEVHVDRARTELSR